MNKKLRAKLATVAVISLTCEPETERVRGNALASGDPVEDKKQEDWIFAQIEGGNEWAWCTTRVSATFAGFEGTAYLGCCSYMGEADFKQEDGYYPQMVVEALDDLAKEIEEGARAMRELRGA